jgi:hypothetical protein
MMKRIHTGLILIIFSLTFTGFSQERYSGLPDSLEKMFSRLRNDLPVKEKLAINDSVLAIMDSYAGSDTVFNHRFSNLRFLGQITSPDSLLKIITWNLILDDGANRYYSYFIKREKKEGAGSFIKLKGSYTDKAERTDTVYSSSDWYGALYYDLRPFDYNGSTKYIILGIDYGNTFITRKLIDVVSFGKGTDITFGLNCFSDGRNLKQRVVFEYSSRAVMSLKFETDNTIVFDHLSPFSPQYRDNRQFYGPDFSFDSFNYYKGLWRYKGDIDIKNK